MSKQDIIKEIKGWVAEYESMVKACEKTENLVPLSFRGIAEMQTETYKTALENMRDLLAKATGEKEANL